MAETGDEAAIIAGINAEQKRAIFMASRVIAAICSAHYAIDARSSGSGRSVAEVPSCSGYHRPAVLSLSRDMAVEGMNKSETGASDSAAAMLKSISSRCAVSGIVLSPVGDIAETAQVIKPTGFQRQSALLLFIPHFFLLHFSTNRLFFFCAAASCSCGKGCLLHL